MLTFIKGILSFHPQELSQDASKPEPDLNATPSDSRVDEKDGTAVEHPTDDGTAVEHPTDADTIDTTCLPPPQEALPHHTSDIEPSEYYEPGGVPIFRPTMEEFSDFKAFVQKIEKYGRKSGIVKIIPPQEWSDSLTPCHTLCTSFKIKKPILQHMTSAGLPAGAYRALNVESRRSYSVSEWFNVCMSDEKREPCYDDYGELRVATCHKKKRKFNTSLDLKQKPNEQETGALIEKYCKTNEYTREYCQDVETFYWRNMAYTPAMYGADLLGSVFELTGQGGSWNLNHLDNLLQKIPGSVPGVNVPYLYFGMWKATFAWHLEDMDLFSINFIHLGAPKQWYVIPPDYATRFEQFAQGLFTQESNTCSQFLRHKNCMISPRLIKSHSIPVHRMIQRQGEIIITFPNGYHAGYNLGFNCAESVNFALDSWIELGKKAKVCQCVDDSVQVNLSDILDPPHSTEPARHSTEQPARVEIKKKKAIKPPPKPRVEQVPRKIKQKCALCIHTEGDVIATDIPDTFCHEICALFIPETWFEHTAEGQMIVRGMNQIPADRWRLKCDICRRRNPYLVKLGACIQCTKGRCVKSYHVTCAQELGLHMKLDDQGVMECFCPQHNPSTVQVRKKQKQQESLLKGSQLQPGDEVIAKGAGGIAFEGVIESTFPDQQCCLVHYSSIESTSAIQIPWSHIKKIDSKDQPLH